MHTHQHPHPHREIAKVMYPHIRIKARRLMQNIIYGDYPDKLDTYILLRIQNFKRLHPWSQQHLQISKSHI